MAYHWQLGYAQDRDSIKFKSSLNVVRNRISLSSLIFACIDCTNVALHRKRPGGAG